MSWTCPPDTKVVDGKLVTLEGKPLSRDEANKRERARKSEDAENQRHLPEAYLPNLRVTLTHRRSGISVSKSTTQRRYPVARSAGAGLVSPSARACFSQTKAMMAVNTMPISIAIQTHSTGFPIFKTKM